jgi:two-component system NarL family sensor kinase
MQNDVAQLIATIIVGSLVVLLLGAFLVVFLFFHQRKKYEYLKDRAQFSQEILRAQLEVQNSTLQQIGEELHDNIGQLLSVAKINLNILEDTEQSIDNQGYIRQTNEIIGQSITDLRALTKSFDGDFVKDFGLEESLSHELLRIRKTNKYQTELVVSGSRFSLGYEKEIVLFRIGQEVLNNILKHARATKILAQLTYESKKFIFCLQDNGRGFEYLATENKGLKQSGAGLRNMKRRAELIGAHFNLTSEPGKGTRIEIELPFSENSPNLL